MNWGDSPAAAETRISPTFSFESLEKKTSVPARAFYANYHSHRLHLLYNVVRKLRQSGRHLVFFAGDSSLDNKHWLYPTDDKYEDDLSDESYCADACNGYEAILTPKRSIRDVAYWFNFHAAAAGSQMVAVNAAVEASTLQDRASGTALLGHDVLIRDFLQPNDVVVVSVGGNDIALRPGIRTMLSVSWLAFFAKEKNVEGGNAYGFGQLRSIFLTQLQGYVQALCSKTKPRKVIVCMIYHPSEAGEGWADPLLNLLGYNDQNPTKRERIQTLLDVAFREFTCKVAVPGVEVVPLALARVLDSSDDSLFENRVEPSVRGGNLMGKAFFDIANGEVLEAQLNSRTMM